MDEFEIEAPADPDLEAPVLVEGLPGIGHVGKLAAEHLLEEFDAERLGDVEERLREPVVARSVTGLVVAGQH